MFTSGANGKRSVVSETLRRLDRVVVWIGRAIEVHLSKRWPIVGAIGVAGLAFVIIAIGIAGYGLMLADDVDLAQLGGAVNEALADDKGSGLEVALADVDHLRDRTTLAPPNTRYASPESVAPKSPFCAPMRKSSKPSPLTSPAALSARPERSPASMPLTAKPLLPVSVNSESEVARPPCRHHWATA